MGSVLPWTLAVPAATHAATAPCTVVAGGGRIESSPDPQVNDRWNRLNFAFFDAAAEAIRAGEPVEQAFFPVGSADAAKNTASVLAQAVGAGCTRLAFFSVFSDAAQADAELVFSMRVWPIRRSPDAVAALGPLEYERDYRFVATPASFDKVVPSRIADQAVRDYRSGHAAASSAPAAR